MFCYLTRERPMNWRNILRNMLILLCVWMMDLFALSPEEERFFLQMSGVEESLSKISNFKGYTTEPQRFIIRIKRENYRQRVIDLLKRKNISMVKQDSVLVIEWGGGGLNYRCLYIAKIAIFFKVNNDGEMQYQDIVITDEFKNKIVEINKILCGAGYYGDISGRGADFPTYIITTISKEAREHVAILYGAVIPKLKKEVNQTKDMQRTLKLNNLIIQLKEICKLEPESGA